MTATPEELKARARHAFEQSIADAGIEPHGAVDPEELARLERAVRSLPRTTREVFLANRIDDSSYDEIAAAIGLNRQQIIRHMAKALYQLARSMEGAERPAWQRWLLARRPRWL